MKLVLMSGGVGGARMARGLAAVPGIDLTVIVNVGDDEQIYGLSISPDIDTVIYTMAGIEGPHGWGLKSDSFDVMGSLAALPIDTTFQIGDRDLATNLFRTDRIAAGWSLTWVTTAVASAFGVNATVLPATDDPLRTQVQLAGGQWVSFQDYFVLRSHADEVADVRFEGAGFCHPAPGVLEAITSADAIVIAPSNPILSIWPVLSVPGISEGITDKPMVLGLSPLIGGSSLKGPAHRVLASLGFEAGTAGVIAAYGGLLTDLLIDTADAADAHPGRPRIHVADTHMADLAGSVRVAESVLAIIEAARS